MPDCHIGDIFDTINGTATACNIPMRDRGAALHVTTTILCSIALACILLRLLSAPTPDRKWTQIADDWYMMMNAVLLIGMMACTILLRNNNYGSDIWTLTTRQIQTIMIVRLSSLPSN